MKTKSKILIVEDDAIIAGEISLRLERFGYEVVGTVESGEMAIQKSSDVTPDLILMDIHLKGKIDGIETTERILATQDIPIIFLTAYADEKTVTRAKNTEPYGYLVKPFDPVELEKTIEDALNKHTSGVKYLENEHWFSATLKNISDGIITTDNNGIINFVNEAAQKILSFNKESLLEKSVNNLFKVYDYNTNNELDNLVMNILVGKKKEIFNNELILERSDKQSIIVEASIDKIVNGKAIVEGAVIVFHDISNRKNAELIFKESEQKYRTLFESMAQGVIYQDLDGSVISVNKAALKILGLSEDQLMGRKPIDPEWRIIHEDGTDFPIEEILSSISLKTGKPVNDVIVGIYIPQEKNISWIVFNTVPEYRENETKPFRIFTTFTDITELKKSQDELKKSEENLLGINKIKDKFFSIVAHDLKSPFQGLLGYANIIKDEIDELDLNEIKRIAGNIYSATNNLYKLVEHLLAWSRLQTDRMKFNPVKLELLPTILNIVNLFGPNARNKKITIESKIQEEDSVFADENMLNSILENLISNAIKFTATGGNITIDRILENDFVTIRVNDSGVGIDKDDLNSLFRIDATHTSKGTDGEEGTGLGLILCKELVGKCGGRIWVESELGVGSSFFFSLPRA